MCRVPSTADGFLNVGYLEWAGFLFLFLDISDGAAISSGPTLP
jgi:hypothetical protein